MQSAMALDKFPFEILEVIFSFLGVSDRLAASAVCKRWYHASLNVNIWKGTTVSIGAEKTAEGLNMLMNCERPFSCVSFEDCGSLFPHALDMCKVIGQQLSILHFKNCCISGRVFIQILSECPNLSCLGAIDCETLFSSQMWLTEPEEIQQLKITLQNVKELDLSCNKELTDMFFTRLSQVFTNVKSLTLAKCPISFQIIVFKRYYRYPNTEPSDNILTFPWIKQFVVNNAKTITSLNFNGTAIDDAALKALVQIEGLQLESISLAKCNLVTAYGVKELCQCQRNLKKLNLQVPMVLDRVLPKICDNLFQLRELYVRNYWSPEKVTKLVALKTENLSSLVKLDLNSCSDALVLKFIDSVRSDAYPKLRHLNFHNDKVDDCFFIYMVPYLLHITYLDLGGTLITDKSLILISTHLIRLQVLRLAQCNALTDDGLVGHVKENSGLFDHHAPQGLTENENAVGVGNSEFLKWLVFDDQCISLSNLKGLRELNLYNISGITDEGLKAAVVFRELRCLSIGGSSKITDEGLCNIVKNNSSLEILSLRFSDEVTENGIAKILNHLPRLRLLDLQGCRKLRETTLSSLVKVYSFRLKYFL